MVIIDLREELNKIEEVQEALEEIIQSIPMIMEVKRQNDYLLLADYVEELWLKQAKKMAVSLVAGREIVIEEKYKKKGFFLEYTGTAMKTAKRR